MDTADKSSKKDFPMLFDMETSETVESIISNQLTSSLEGSPAKTSVLPASKRELKDHDRVFGQRCIVLLGSYDPDMRSLKTSQTSLDLGLTESSVILPKSGMMRNGRLWEQTTLVRRTEESESGLLPTPQATDGTVGEILNENTNIQEAKSGKLIKISNTGAIYGMTLTRLFYHYFQFKMPSTVSEEIMGYPLGWTDLKDSETPLSPKSQESSEE